MIHVLHLQGSRLKKYLWENTKQLHSITVMVAVPRVDHKEDIEVNKRDMGRTDR